MAHSPRPVDTREAILLGHQPDQVEIGSIVRFGIGLTISVILVFVVILFLLRYFEGRDIARADDQSPMMQVTDPTLFPRPRLQEHPTRNLDQYRAEIADKVNSYGWVDQKAGIARIPIGRAMELTAERGIPKSAAPAPSETPPAPLPTPEATTPAELGPDGEQQGIDSNAKPTETTKEAAPQ